LEDDVVAIAVLVHERRTDGDPKVVVSFTLVRGVCKTVRQPYLQNAIEQNNARWLQVPKARALAIE
jgi:hypothetical protein